MDEIQQTQKAGDNAVQNQIGTQIVVGIDEKRVREICDEKIATAVRDLSFDAIDLAHQRINTLTDKVVEKIKENPTHIQAFSDPSFQRDIVRAQIAAAESDREPDIETLAELLLARMNGKLKRSTKTGLRKAIEIVSELEDEELTALTVLLFCSRYLPNNTMASHVDQYLAYLDGDFAKLFAKSSLPEGTRWLKHLSILNCVEVNHFGSFKKVEDYYSEAVAGIVCAGITNDSAEHHDAAMILDECGIGSNMLVPNDLLPGYVRLPVANLDDLSTLPMIIPNVPRIITMTPNEKQKEGLAKVINLYSKDSALLQKVKATFAEKISGHGTLNQFKTWLSNLKHSFELTPIGEVLAYVNARRCIPELPVIELE